MNDLEERRAWDGSGAQTNARVSLFQLGRFSRKPCRSDRKPALERALAVPGRPYMLSPWIWNGAAVPVKGAGATWNGVGLGVSPGGMSVRGAESIGTGAGAPVGTGGANVRGAGVSG